MQLNQKTRRLEIRKRARWAYSRSDHAIARSCLFWHLERAAACRRDAIRDKANAYSWKLHAHLELHYAREQRIAARWMCGEDVCPVLRLAA